MYARTFSGEIYVINYIYTRILVSFLQLCCHKREENSMRKTSKPKKTDKCFPLFKDDDKCYRRIAFCDTESGKEYSDLMELHVLELSKLPPEQQNETDIMKWMRFFGGKCEEDFKKMAEKDEYIGEAYEVLKNMSEDEIKRMEYEARQKAIRDYNSYMHSAERRGIKLGREELLKQQVKKKLSKGQSVKVIAEDLVEDIDVIQKIVDELDKA